ncbi:MAG: zf-HC2 domain-containing protein [Oscillospiraceae bacterium]|nr:zf-HC2 domain-containing protein [Oscillospiraceae bacterium]
MNYCEHYLEQINAYIDGELDADETADLRRHIEACPDCKRVLMACRNVSSAFAAAEAEPPVGFADGVMARIGTKPAKRSHAWRFLAAAAVFVVVGVLAWAADWGGIDGDADEAGLTVDGGGSGAYHQMAEAEDTASATFRGRTTGASEEIVEFFAAPEDMELWLDNYAEIFRVETFPDGSGLSAFWIADMTLFDLATVGEQWNWAAFTQALAAEGFAYQFDRGGFRVADRNNPGSVLYGWLEEDVSRPEEFVVSRIEYHFHLGDVSRRVEIRIQDGVVRYYFGTQADAVSAPSLERILHYILTGNR